MTSLADDTRWMDATDQAAAVARGDVTAVELLDAAVERIAFGDGALNAVTIRWFDEARRIAAAVDQQGTHTGGRPSPFAGVPFLLKDLWAHFAGQTLSNGNVALRDAAPLSDADTTLVARFRAAGLVIAGRTNSPEFGSLPTTEPVAWGATRNPWSLAHSPGGSSGGAAAAVAAGFVPMAHASDGGGSIRIPASNCGLVGLKPTQGRITLGPFRDESNLGVELCVSRTVRDTAALLDAVHGPGVGDTVIAAPWRGSYADEVRAGAAGDVPSLRIGILDHHPDGSAVHVDCAAAARHVGALLERLGHSVEPAFPTVLADREASRRFMAMWATNMAVSVRRIEAQLGRPLDAHELEPVNRAQADFANSVSGVDFAMALAAQADFRRALQAWWAPHGRFDLLLTPTMGEPPALIGTFANDVDQPMRPMNRAASYVPFTPAYNITGQPAINVPIVWNSDGLPIGTQLVGAYGREDLLLRAAAQLEAAEPWASRQPMLP
jgi:amidase